MSKLVEIDGLLKRDPDIQGMEADDNIITPFKGRTIDTDKPIDVYRNLNRKGKIYSVRQNGLVVAHTTAICIRNAKFVVNQSGKARAIKTKQRNVHAFIRGLFATSGCGTTAKANKLGLLVKYDPFLDKGFYSHYTGNELKGAEFVIVNEFGVGASYTH